MDRKSALESIGYKIVGEFYAGRTTPFLVEKGQLRAVAKIFYYLNYDNAHVFNHIRRDSEILLRLQPLALIPRHYESGEIDFKGEKYAYEIREHIMGDDIYYENSISNQTLTALEKLVRSVHDLGIARLNIVVPDTDNEQWRLVKHNVLITKEGLPYLHDLGDVVCSGDTPPDEFEDAKQRDIEGFEFLKTFVRP